MIHASALIPILLPLFTPTTLSPPTGELALTAPSPSLAATTAVVTVELALAAPSPTVSAPLEPPTGEMHFAVDDPATVGDGIISPSAAELAFTAPDPSLAGPVFVAVDGITVQFTAPDPAISFNFVVNEDTLDVPGVPLQSSRDDLHRYQLALLLNETARGRLACTGKMTLIASVGATFLRDSRLGPKSVVHFDPLTANAAAELFAGTMYVLEANRGEGQWVITHANAATVDRKFRYTILGWG